MRIFRACSIVGGSGHWKSALGMAWSRGKVLVVLISESENCILLSMIILICFIVQYTLDSLNNIIFLIACICHIAGN